MSYETVCGRCGQRGAFNTSHVCMADVLAELKRVGDLLQRLLDREAVELTP